MYAKQMEHIRRAQERERYHQKTKERQDQAAALPDESPAPTRLRQAVYNLNHAYKTKARQLEMTPQEYAQSTLGLRNPITPEKRAAILEQRKATCRCLLDETTDSRLEEELGIETEDFPILGPTEEQEAPSKSLHDKVKLFYTDDDVSRMLPHARYASKHGAARIMLQTIKDAYGMFKQKNPEDKIGLTLFQDLRPPNVKLMGKVPLESCLCVYCTNIRCPKTCSVFRPMTFHQNENDNMIIHYDETERRVDLMRRKRKSEEIVGQFLDQPPMLSEPAGVSQDKKRDLISLCSQNLIPPAHHSFF